MKKLNYLLLGLAGLAMASCSQEDLNAPSIDGDGNVQFNITIPGNIGTRAVTELGTGFNANKLLIAVYENKDGDNATSATLGNPVLESTGDFAFSTTNTSGDLSTKVNLNLVAGKSYYVAFFAASETSLTPPDDNSEPVYVFDTESNQLKVNYSSMTSASNNANAYECFYKLYNTKTIASGGNSFDVVLTRPVAQINWGTSENLTPAQTGNSPYQEVINTFGADGEYIVTTAQLTNVPNVMNFADMSVTGQTDVTFTGYSAPWGATYPVNPSTYNYVAMQYVLAAQTSATSNMTLTITNKANEDATEVTNDIVVTSAPFQANYRTNIYGSLLSENTEFNVTKQDFFDGATNSEIGGAMVKIENGKVTCITPNLPSGVTVQDLKDNSAGAVAIGADGTPEYYGPTSKEIKNALAKYSEIYFAPNAEITTNAHELAIVASNPNVTIHGNGATLKNSENDFSINALNLNGGTVNITINNLNNVKVWGTPTGDGTFNFYLNNCTMTGTGRTDTSSLIMTRGSANLATIINFYIDGCQVQDVQVAMHSTYIASTIDIRNCKFTNVGIPLNYAKKTAGATQVTISDCVFITCGIVPEDPNNKAWDYAAPIRVVDFVGPEAYSTSLFVDGCTFINTLSQWDILLWDYRTDETRTSYPIEYSHANCYPTVPSVNTIDKVTTMPDDAGN